MFIFFLQFYCNLRKNASKHEPQFTLYLKTNQEKVQPLILDYHCISYNLARTGLAFEPGNIVLGPWFQLGNSELRWIQPLRYISCKDWSVYDIWDYEGGGKGLWSMFDSSPTERCAVSWINLIFAEWTLSCQLQVRPKSDFVLTHSSTCLKFFFFTREKNNTATLKLFTATTHYSILII